MGDIDDAVKRYRVIDDILLFAIKHLLNQKLLVPKHRLVMLRTSCVGLGIYRLERLRRQMNIEMLGAFEIIFIV